MLCKMYACLGETPSIHAEPEFAEAYQAFVQAAQEKKTAQEPQSLTHQQVSFQDWRPEQHVHP